VLAREAIDHWLAARQAEAVREAVTAYAQEAAGTPDDLDVGLEAAAVEQLHATGGRTREGRKGRRS
jgi:hypothetical protein